MAEHPISQTHERETLRQAVTHIVPRRNALLAEWRANYLKVSSDPATAERVLQVLPAAFDGFLDFLADRSTVRWLEAAENLGQQLAEREVPYLEVPFLLAALERTLDQAFATEVHGAEFGRLSTALTAQMNLYRAAVAEGYFGVQRRALESTIQRLEEMDHLKDDFLSVITHDLRTPLTFIMAYAESLEDGFYGELNAQEHDAVRHILESAKRLNHQVEDLLETNRLVAGKLRIEPEPFDYLQMAAEEVEKIRHSCQKPGVAISFHAPEHLPPMQADPQRVSQVLDNLLSNACKFTSEGEIRVEVRQQGSRIETRVSDTGIGISPDEQRGLFSRFYQLEGGRRKRGGSGLGLFIVKSLLSAMNGTITLESSQDAGSVFSFSLPAASPH